MVIGLSMGFDEEGNVDREDLTFEEVLDILKEQLDETGVEELDFNDD